MADQVTEAANRLIKPLEWIARPQDWLETEEDFEECAHTQYDAYCPFGKFEINEYRDHVTWNVCFDDRNTSSFDADSVDAAKQAAFDYWCERIGPCLVVSSLSRSSLVDVRAVEAENRERREAAKEFSDAHFVGVRERMLMSAADTIDSLLVEIDRLNMIAGGEEAPCAVRNGRVGIVR